MKRCSNGEKNSSKLIFSENGLGTNGLRSQCIIGTKHYHSDNKEKNKFAWKKKTQRYKFQTAFQYKK